MSIRKINNTVKTLIIKTLVNLGNSVNSQSTVIGKIN
jgi:hypothetical protein